jgi:hypothetical protein
LGSDSAAKSAPRVLAGAAGASVTTWPQAMQALVLWLAWTDLELQRGQFTG